ncbi:hypothetical protein AMTRI_Chr06g176840 [Amborella trichopoda]|uniref:UspA domain-containing protein n=1 Tax=Amborella trichopoda TaxID=13333 RepID=W1PZG9_AMBTC|nr:U-box domain-containing protein 35 [Amborella trichopoda]ERN13778.1 hypothetical protein AMTR_s00049p00196550 [Amborella trichopoda]|eukprot:XP_006852311.1 U-box domain-containing protein 35 [Amborella trichopoda]
MKRGDDNRHETPAETKAKPELYFSRAFQSEIEEVLEERESIEIVERESKDDIYVAVGKKESSYDALRWAINFVVKPGCLVYLVHVFPPVNYIPSPVGRIPKSQVGPEYLKAYMNEESVRRRSLLQKYISLCSKSKVKVDIMLIESEIVEKAIVELIPVLNIKRLVMGSRRSSRRQRRHGKAELVRKNAPEYCEVTVVNAGKVVPENQETTPPFAIPLKENERSSSKARPEFSRKNDRNFFECTCFSGKFVQP